MVMGELTTRVDVAVIGAGPGGYTAAIRAAQLGLDVVLIEKNKIGGCCTNVGCIPSKALIHAATVKFEAEHAANMGIDAEIKLDFAKTQKWKDGVVEKLRNGIEMICRFNGVDVIKGKAFFTSSNTLSVQTENGMRDIEFKNVIIATGTRIKELPNLPQDHKKVISSDDIFSLDKLPQRLIVVGGGYIAIEMACLFTKFGSRVVVIYRGSRLLKKLEPEISITLARKMKEIGCEIVFDGEVESVQGNVANVKAPDGIRKLEFDKLLITTGRVPDYEGLGLDKTKVSVNTEGLIEVDNTMRTKDEKIFAIGDIVAGPQLAHKAFRQGKVAAEVIANQKSAFDNVAIPSVVFSEPEIATVGLTEQEANEQGHKIKIGRMPYTSSGKAKTMDKTDGFVKIVANEDGLVLGVHVIGFGAADLIAEATLAIEMGATLEDLALTIHTHPTMPEALAEAAEEALGQAIHLYKGKM
ncbi:Dihydrolipoyl dehydrogenase [Candidatus Bilamarchaeum dharawalense]|uniref:Dihydrolipoyl dehydrogenase n=1 Tax=Candidatus Bilamarchaeum dharawalense TaxID=2885759 RepID=A0A5E4LKL6_9ARCH|nr:Dihydrolipoyl dehydrogenase [Candidatus Bilamarchaeum dharawalense]